jgi:8-oxo-dGTP pyrophosphatase MutT (NUDIX family)
MELCDIVDESGNRTGRVAPRGSALSPGEFFSVVHVWIRDEFGNYLIQQRAFDRPSDPGIWAITAGYVLAGEDSLSGAIREVEEELGIQLSPARLKRFDRHVLENRLEDIWLADIPRSSMGTPTSGPEVADWKWVSKVELEQMAGRNDFFRYSYFDDILSVME